MINRSVLLLLLLLLLAFSQALPVIDPRVLQDTENDQIGSFSIHLSSKANLASAFSIKDHDAKGYFVLEAVRKHAHVTQAPILQLLRDRSDVVTVNPFYISNCIFVKAKRSVVDMLAKRQDIKAINSNRPFKVDLERTESTVTSRFDAIEWNINYVKAPLVWEKYNTTGAGIYGVADTGIDYKHPALITNYKGNNGSGFANDYNWWDGVKEAAIPGVGSCGIDAQFPCDDNSHGTHCTGTSVGQNGIGVAPGAKWIGCRNMDRGYGTVQSYLSCLQFFLAPTDLKGNNPSPSLRPWAVGNSYGCITSEGCVGDEFTEAVEVLRASGVFMSVSAGNSGPACSTVESPPAIEPSVISVAATALNSDAIASFSSRGPVGNLRKPDISAPGSSVLSSIPGGGYGTKSGTSMAAPHIGAYVNLVISVCPQLLYNVDALQDLLQRTARTLFTNQGCGGDFNTTSPNHVFGYGILDLEAATSACSSQRI